MIRDLASGAPGGPVLADVLVIGAGTAGLILASRLARAGLRIVVLESGSRTQDAETHPLNAVVQAGQPYAGAEHGRFRCLGGTSTRWGGAMLPFLPDDMEAHSAGWDIDWPVSYDEVADYVPQVEHLFHLPNGSYDHPDLVGTEVKAFMPRLAKWPSFKRRNVAALLAEDLDSPSLDIWINATVTEMTLGESGRLAGVTARSAGGTMLTVHADETVIAAGAIESTRLLLEMDRAAGDRLFAPFDILGRYFHDHLSAEVADVLPKDRTALNRLNGFRFEGEGMRNLRFEPIGTVRRKLGLPSGFAHIAFRSRQRGGVDALRDILRDMQRRRLPALADAGLLVRAAPWLSRAVWWRYVHKRLLVPSDARFDLHLVLEQEPHADNRITLDNEARDAYGQPLARIDWRVRAPDLDNFERLLSALTETWAGSRLSTLADLDLYEPDRWRASLSKGGDVFHPGGTVRMGRSAQNSVVDANLRTHAVPNLRVLSTATFPSGGGANPTMMLIAFALRMADDLAQGRAVS